MLPAETCGGRTDTTGRQLTNGSTPQNDFFENISSTPGTFADFDGDGGGDAAFIVECTFGASGGFGELLVLFASGDSLLAGSLPEQQQAVGTDGYLRSFGLLGVAGDDLVVEWQGALPDDARCCPSISAVTTFDLDTRQLVPTNVDWVFVG